jgi:hypothetical protein
MGDVNHLYDIGEFSPLAVMRRAQDGYMGSTDCVLICLKVKNDEVEFIKQ